MDEDEQIDIDDAALAHQQELESRQWQEWLRADPAYEQWLQQFAAEAALRTETNDGDHR